MYFCNTLFQEKKKFFKFSIGHKPRREKNSRRAYTSNSRTRDLLQKIVPLRTQTRAHLNIATVSKCSKCNRSRLEYDFFLLKVINFKKFISKGGNRRSFVRDSRPCSFFSIDQVCCPVFRSVGFCPKWQKKTRCSGCFAILGKTRQPV